MTMDKHGEGGCMRQEFVSVLSTVAGHVVKLIIGLSFIGIIRVPAHDV